MEEKLLEVKGVVSFTFNMAIQRCYLRVRYDLKPEDLCGVVSATERLAAQQVVKNENGEEVRINCKLLSVHVLVIMLLCFCIVWFRFFFPLDQHQRHLFKTRKRINQ